MAYRESRRRCKSCGRVTLHWLPTPDCRPPRQDEGGRASVAALIRTLGRRLTARWRCVECDHPWEMTLLGRSGGPPEHRRRSASPRHRP